MNLIPWRNKQKNEEHQSGGAPLPTLRNFRFEIDRMFDRLLEGSFTGLADSWTGLQPWGPSLDVSEDEKCVYIKAELPGVDPNAVEVTITGDVLTISGEKNESEERRDESYVYTERRFGSFRRSVQLPTYVDSQDVVAEDSHGLLTIRLKKSEKAMPKQIPVVCN